MVSAIAYHDRCDWLKQSQYKADILALVPEDFHRESHTSSPKTDHTSKSPTVSTGKLIDSIHYYIAAN
jgi:hypothetical protein